MHASDSRITPNATMTFLRRIAYCSSGVSASFSESSKTGIGVPCKELINSIKNTPPDTFWMIFSTVH